jgi:flagella basal body P-ring formation protein FlgA
MTRAQSAERRAQSVLVPLLAVALFLLAAPLSAQPTACTPIAARALARGETLTVDDIAVAGQGGRSALCALRSALVGSVTRRMIAAGEPLREPAVAPANAIAANQQVSVIYRDAGIEVRLTGVAANAAPVGGRVTVRVAGAPRSGVASRSLDGVAIGAGLVQVK